MAKLARDVSNEDFTCLVYFATGLVKVIIGSRVGKTKLEKQPNARKLDLLTRWCHSILDHLMFTPEVDNSEDICLAVLDLVHAYFDSRRPFHSAELEDVMTCIITWCLASLPPSFSERDLDHVVKILATSCPSGSIYSSLISRIFSLSSEEEFSTESIEEIRSFAASLRFNRLSRLEVQFIKQALTHLENSVMVTWGHEPEYKEFRFELAKNLKEAEVKIKEWDCSTRDHELSEEEGFAKDLDLPSSPPFRLKKRRRTDPNGELHYPSKKKQKYMNRKAPPALVEKPFRKESKSRNCDSEISNIDRLYDESVATRRLVRQATYDESDHTPEVEADGRDTNEDDDSDGHEGSRGPLSFHSSSSDDVLDLFSFPDTSPVVVRLLKH
jgi:hypothetical protein